MSEELARARSYVLALLARRDYPRSTLERKLKLRKLDSASIKVLLDDLTERGIFREELYVRARTRQLLRKGEGPRLVKARLKRQKCEIGDADIEAAREILGENAEEPLRRLVVKTLLRWRRKGELEAREVERKCFQSLAPKGHESSLLLRLIREENKRLQDNED